MRSQRGMSLLIVLVGLSMLVIGGLALYQSAQTTMLASGNIAQQQSAVAVADIGINAATNFVQALSAPDSNVANRYFATQQAADEFGLPNVSWSSVPVQASGSFSVQYVVERLCDPPLPVTNAATQCSVGPALNMTASHRVGSAAYATQGKKFYRVTVRVTGPRNGESFAQALLSR